MRIRVEKLSSLEEEKFWKVERIKKIVLKLPTTHHPLPTEILK